MGYDVGAVRLLVICHSDLSKSLLYSSIDRHGAGVILRIEPLLSSFVASALESLISSPMPLGLALYRFLTQLARPFLGLVLHERVRRGKENPATLPDRYARCLPRRPDAGPFIWLHAASVGESMVQIAVAKELCREHPDVSCLFSCQTETAARLIRVALETDPAFSNHWVRQVMAPLDTPGIARRFVRHWRPDLAIFAEGDVWPNLLRALRSVPCSTALINGRMTEKSLLGWGRWPTTALDLFSGFDLILASDVRTSAGLTHLSRRPVASVGNLKTALPPPMAEPKTVAGLRSDIGDRSVLLAASTHPGEEAIVIDALMQIPGRPFLILAPRHPERGDSLAGLLDCSGLKIARRTRGDPITPQTDVLLADTLGEMGLWYRLADTVYLGGGHAPGVGGHNPLEALRLGKPILTGPGVFNFADMMADLEKRGGVTFVSDSMELMRNYPASPPSSSLVKHLSQAGFGPMGKTLDALRPLIQRAKGTL